MKLTIELPDWCEGRHIFVLAGTELAAYKPADRDEALVKQSRCNLCGYCCTRHPKNGFPTDADGACAYLVTIGTAKECSLGTATPWQCCWSDPHLAGWDDAEEHCAIRYKRVKTS